MACLKRAKAKPVTISGTITFNRVAERDVVSFFVNCLFVFFLENE
jgi:hypothetical protein